jgi:hypothetical protein
MNNYFTVKVKCSEQNAQGIFKRKVYTYLVSGHTFTEAESKIYEFFEPFKNINNLLISSIQRADFHEILDNLYSSKFCVVKISFDNTSEEKTKKIIQKLLVTADNIEEATALVMEKFSITTLDYKIESVSSSVIVDVLTDEHVKVEDFSEKNVKENNLEEEEELIEPIILNK